MSRICQNCGKKSTLVTRLVKLRGKYNPTTKKRKYPNLQVAVLPSGKKAKICTECMRTFYKEKK